MPDIKTAQELRDIVLEDQPYRGEDAQLSSAEAGNVVLKTFQDYQTDRRQNQEPRWNKDDRLYFGWVKQRFWKGSKNQKRSSLPIQVVMDHMESAYPHIMLSLFSQEPYWFEVIPDLGSTVEQAQAKQARLSFVLDQQAKDPDNIGITALSECKRAGRSAMQYGNGYGQVGYDPIEGRPFLEYLNIRDVYLPPGLGQWVDRAPAWIKRKLMTVEELRELRDHPDMNIPDDETLNGFAKNRSNDDDYTKQAREALRGITEDPGRQEQDPIKQDVEVLIYESKSRIIWILGRKWVAYNQANPWKMLTLVGTPYLPVLDSQWGLSFGDLLEHEQRLQQGVTNAILDEVSLNMDPPRVASHGALSHPQQLLAFRPGGLYKAQKPNEDFMPQSVGQVTRDAYVIAADSRTRAHERSGVNQMMVQGVPTPSNANRTATGVRGQAQASAMRLFTPIDTFETFFLIPMLMKMDRIMQIVEARGGQGLPGRGPEGQTVEVAPAALSAQVTYKLSAGSKLRAKEALMPVLPFLLQYLMNPQLVQQMQAIGKTPNIVEIDRLVQEATGTARRYEFFRDMTPQEIQTRQSSGQPEQQAEMQQKQMELQARMQIARDKNETTLQAKEIDREISAEEIALKIMELLSKEGSEALKARVDEVKARKSSSNARSK